MNVNEIFKDSKVTHTNFKIYLDMDGVLVNWNKGFKETLMAKDPEIIKLTGFDINESPYKFEDKLFQHFIDAGFNEKKAKSKAKARFWKVIHGDFDWWINLDWLPDGKELLEYCVNLKKTGKIKELNILSSPSSDAVCEPGKRAWLDKHDVTKYFDNIIIFKDKYKYASGPTDILVDDTPKKIKEWVEISNGSGILHTSAKDSISKIGELLS